MKQIWKIFARDWKSISTNWVAMILIGGLIVLPSLYAWFNIKASWDPYSQTDQLPVAVVNEDEGATVRDTEIDVGKDLVEELKDNDSFDWQFTDRDTAMDKVEYGDYYAVIVIPDTFSEKLGTVVSDQPEKSKVEYYVNEKINAIAPKITEKGASVIVDQITNAFVSEVNGTVAELFNDLGLELEKDLPDIKRFEEYVFKLEENLPEIYDLISGAYDDSENAASIINDVQGLLPRADQVTRESLGTIDETTSFLNEAEQRLNELAPQVEADLKKAQQTAEDVNSFIQDVQSVDLDLEGVTQLKDGINQRTVEAMEQLNTVENLLQQIQEQQQQQQEEQNGDENAENGEENQNQQTGSEVSQETVNQALKEVKRIREGLQNVQNDAGQLEEQLKDSQTEIDQTLTTLEEKSGETADRIDAFLTEYNENIEPRVLEEINQAQQTLADARSILTEAQSTIPQISQILGSTESNLAEGQDILEYMLNEYPYVNEKVNQMAERIRDIQGETDINEIIELLKNDPEAEQSFFEEPVSLSKNTLFPIENYGTGMTPFYTVLAIWVGALLLISLLATEPVHTSEYRSYKQYLGKLATFVSIGFLQTFVVTLGNLFLLNIGIAESLYFVLFGLGISFVFMTIVFTLVSVLGDVGKAGAIVFLVLQIAGSGGTYPVALLPEFFQNIHPFLPFSYAVDLLREAVGGIVEARVKTDVIRLSAFAGLFLAIGIFLKGPLHDKSRKLMKKSRESGLFH